MKGAGLKRRGMRLCVILRAVNKPTAPRKLGFSGVFLETVLLWPCLVINSPRVSPQTFSPTNNLRYYSWLPLVAFGAIPNQTFSQGHCLLYLLTSRNRELECEPSNLSAGVEGNFGATPPVPMRRYSAPARGRYANSGRSAIPT